MSELDDSDGFHMATMRFVIKGKVQGVSFRDWTVENANRFGLTGWVRNRSDGSVEALVSGYGDGVKLMGQRFLRGPPDAVVKSLQLFNCNYDPGTTFERRPTV